MAGTKSKIVIRESELDKNGKVILSDTEGIFGWHCKNCNRLLRDGNNGTNMYCVICRASD